MHHVFWPDAAPLCPVVHHRLALADELVELGGAVKVDHADASEGGLGTFDSDAHHFAIDREVFSWPEENA